MPGSFDPVELLEYLRRRWGFLVVVTSCAVATALIGGLLVPKEYTATASIIIEPPGASDPRTATALSPIYLESLKTYEQFAASDTLFVRAAAKFHLLEAQGAPSIESFKQKVLRVNKLKETKVLQLSVTLRDPKVAQSLVEYLATETVNLSRALSRQGDQDNMEEARNQLKQASGGLEHARSESVTAAGASAETALASQIDSLSELDGTLRARVADARAATAEASVGTDLAEVKSRQARADALAVEIVALERELTAKSQALAKARIRRESIDTQLRTTQAAYDSAAKRVQDLSAGSGMRGEQLRIIDPGIVPQRPSYPNIPLDCAAALVIGFVGAVAWLSFRFGVERMRFSAARTAFRVASGGGR